jgi:predicted nucleotidyltransferase
MNIIFKTQFGSHVYGTNLPTSDLDYKAIYIPEPKELLLGKVKETIQEGTKVDKTQRNTKDELLHWICYLRQLNSGNTILVYG